MKKYSDEGEDSSLRQPAPRTKMLPPSKRPIARILSQRLIIQKPRGVEGLGVGAPDMGVEVEEAVGYEHQTPFAQNFVLWGAGLGFPSAADAGGRGDVAH